MEENIYMCVCKAIDKIYSDRKDFLVIGLTGRTGSGCSTVASILNRQSFEQLDLKKPKEYDFKNSEERKYSVIYKYANANNWSKFHIIEMRTIIASFIIDIGYDAFESYIRSIDEIIGIEELKKGIRYLKSDFDQIKNVYNGFDSLEKIEQVQYIERVAELTKKLKNILQNYTYKEQEKESQLYTYIFQDVANNLRASGDPYNTHFDPEKFFIIADRTYKLIEAIREVNRISGNSSNFYCIDAIRNLFEAIYFKDKCSAFYLLSVNTNESMRRRRLPNIKGDQIKSLDEIEYPERLTRERKFYNQNIKACLELADIHIYNPDVDNNKYYFLTEQLLKYVVLMMHPGLITPTHIERCMQIAYNAKLNSGCLSRQVGAVITGVDYSIKAVGWNEVPKGQVSCSLRDVEQYCNNKDQESYSHYELTDQAFYDCMNEVYQKIDYNKLRGRFYPYCFKDVYNKIKSKDNQVYTRALHAEENTFLQITKYGGEGIRGGFLFTTASPCELCAKKAYQLGIKRIFYIDPYPGISQSHILNFGTENNPEMQLFYGAIGNAYISLYTQRISYKDELEMIVEEKAENIIGMYLESKKDGGVTRKKYNNKRLMLQYNKIVFRNGISP